VRDEFDVDCIRCNRCVSGHDTHVMHRKISLTAQEPTVQSD
jgi:polyferredoxin